MNVEDGQHNIPEAPRGMYPARLDDKGRMKMPVPFAEYLSAFPEKKLFVTSLDRSTGQVYPISIWRQNEKFFKEYRADPKAAARVSFTAADLGAEAELDAQGRLTVHPELRRELGIENQAVRIFAHNGRIEVLSEAIYEARKKASMQSLTEDVAILQGEGLI